MLAADDDDDNDVALVRKEPKLQHWRDASNGHSLLHVAARRGKVDLARALLDVAPAAALIDATNKAGQTALHDAAQKGRLEIATLLVERGADIGLHANGKLALDLARDAGRGDVADFLEFVAQAQPVRIVSNFIAIPHARDSAG